MAKYEWLISIMSYSAYFQRLNLAKNALKILSEMAEIVDWWLQEQKQTNSWRKRNLIFENVLKQKNELVLEVWCQGPKRYKTNFLSMM